MPFQPFISLRSFSTLSIVIVLIGMFIRTNVYVQNRSLIIDEANLARNIFERQHSEFAESLSHQQYAPPLFMNAQKTVTQLTGVNEYALKLIPLISGLIGLMFFLLIAKELVPSNVSRWYILALFSFSVLAIRYSSEVKQYSSDAALTLLFIYWALTCRKKGFSTKLALQWAFFGSLAIWFSMPIVFVLAAIGLAFLYQFKSDKKSWLKLFPVGAAWIFSFGIYFFLVLYTDAQKGGLKTYHETYFFDFFINSSKVLLQDLTLLQSLLRSATDQTAISITWAAVTFLFGSFLLVKNHKFSSVIILGPIFFCLLASQLQLYSLIPRLTLFFIPLMMIVMGIGISKLWMKANIYLKAFFVLVMLISVVNKQGYQYLWTTLELEDSKSTLSFLSEHYQDNDPIYVHHDAVPAFIFYTEMHDDGKPFKNYHIANWDEEPITFLSTKSTNHTKDEKGFWLFYAHTFPPERIEREVQSAATLGIETKRMECVGAATFYFKWR